MRFAESKFTGSIIKEKGVTFAIILVKTHFSIVLQVILRKKEIVYSLFLAQHQ